MNKIMVVKLFTVLENQNEVCYKASLVRSQNMDRYANRNAMNNNSVTM